jgi:hypothetical protein
MPHATIEAYNEAQGDAEKVICNWLRQEIDAALPDADSRIWHAHPVWFLDGNPIVGYSKLKDCIRLLFWSGQSFAAPGLEREGTFKAAEKRFCDPDAIDRDVLQAWLAEARAIQWDYKNLVKRRGRLERLV